MSKSPLLEIDDKSAKIFKMLELFVKLNVVKKYKLQRWQSSGPQPIHVLGKFNAVDIIDAVYKWEYEVIK